MPTIAATAIGNAKHRTRLGWPLMLLTIALYAPVGGLPRLALIATGLFFLAQQTPTDSAPDKSAKAAPKTRPAGHPKPNRPPAAKPAPGRTAAEPRRRRNANGRWTK